MFHLATDINYWVSRNKDSKILSSFYNMGDRFKAMDRFLEEAKRYFKENPDRIIYDNGSLVVYKRVSSNLEEL